MTQTQAAWIVLAAVLTTTGLSFWIKGHGRVFTTLAIINILNVIVLQWILGWYTTGTLVAIAVLIACLDAVRTYRPERSKG